MKILADENMPLLEELFGSHTELNGELNAVPGRHIAPDLVADCDVLLVRSVTQVNRELLAGSKVRFVGSATSGIDHIDTTYLDAENITFAHAPGCNANAVVQYMLAVFCSEAPRWRQQTVGIIGCGQVGGRLYRCLRALGVQCRVYDPLLPIQNPDSVSFEQAIAADIICLHTPLTTTGAYPTYHMIDAEVLAGLKPSVLLINASRGAVVDNRALKDSLSTGATLTAVLDVWEPEPNIDTSLMAQLALATPHIAGYSVDGRRNGSEMVYEAFCQWQAQGEAQALDKPLSVEPRSNLELPKGSLEDYILATFDITAESRRMITALAAEGVRGNAEIGRAFDLLRKTCPARREFSHYRITGAVDKALAQDLSALGFEVSEVE
ncbi:MAG: erythronate-4-phosphate dehydrogenase [Porticoccaceae bacterium]|nr:erythronate-4-phosphate dehydrogenase [Porticoccaceae bacterium]